MKVIEREINHSRALRKGTFEYFNEFLSSIVKEKAATVTAFPFVVTEDDGQIFLFNLYKAEGKKVHCSMEGYGVQKDESLEEAKKRLLKTAIHRLKRISLLPFEIRTQLDLEDFSGEGCLCEDEYIEIDSDLKVVPFLRSAHQDVLVV